jgi:hypothetical protein
MTHEPHQGTGHHLRYPGTDQEAAAGTQKMLTTRQRRARVLAIAIVTALLLAILLLHVTGAMPTGTHS